MSVNLNTRRPTTTLSPNGARVPVTPAVVNKRLKRLQEALNLQTVAEVRQVVYTSERI